MMSVAPRLGRFTEVVRAFAGRAVKECDRDVLRALKEAGRLLQSRSEVHSYPHCWR